jgi:hypothetical protein
VDIYTHDLPDLMLPDAREQELHDHHVAQQRSSTLPCRSFAFAKLFLLPLPNP